MLRSAIKMLAVLAPVGAIALSTGCPSREVATVDPRQNREQTKEIPVTLNRKVDILFVIDDSNSMRQEQTSLAQEFPEFINVLDDIEGGLPDVHIGVVSTDMGGPAGYCGEGYDGQLTLNGCSGIDDPYLVDVSDGSGGRSTNYSGGTLAEKFECMAQLGDQGCGFEQPLEAMRRAIEQSEAGGANEGFIRDDAYLAVVLITDEDDCSVSDAQIFSGSAADAVDSEFGPLSSFRCFEYGVDCEPDDRSEGERRNCVPETDSSYLYSATEFANYLKDFKGSGDEVIVAAIRGNPDDILQVGLEDLDSDTPDGGDPDLEPKLQPSCESGNGVAFPAIRIESFLNQFPGQNHSESICEENLAQPLREIAALFVETFGNPCIPGELWDSDPERDGIQPECRVSDVQNKDEDDEQEFPIAACNGDRSNTPCWDVEAQDQCQPPSETAVPTGLALVVDRGGDNAPPNTTLVARCVAQ